MNRIIKFRVWDKENEKFCSEEHDFGFSNDDYVIFISLQLEATDRYIIQQFTGLKDKNGKGIYEGDIVQWNLRKGKAFAKVLFENGCFVIKLKSGMYSLICNELDLIVAVGNIFENPELLK